MTYSNYLDSGHKTNIPTSGTTYINTGMGYWNTGGDPTYQYGTYNTKYWNYTNYCDVAHGLPAAYTITASTAPFADDAGIDRSAVAEIAKLRTDLEKLSVNKVGKTDPISYTPTFAENTDAKLDAAQELKKAQITEITNKVKELWRTITGETAGNESGTWPDLSATNPATLDTDYKQLIQNTQALANIAQPRTNSYLNGVAGTSGYLNCCNTTGVTGYNINAGTRVYGNGYVGGEPSHIKGEGPANLR